VVGGGRPLITGEDGSPTDPKPGELPRRVACHEPVLHVFFSMKNTSPCALTRPHPHSPRCRICEGLQIDSPTVVPKPGEPLRQFRLKGLTWNHCLAVPRPASGELQTALRNSQEKSLKFEYSSRARNSFQQTAASAEARARRLNESPVPRRHYYVPGWRVEFFPLLEPRLLPFRVRPAILEGHV